MTLRPFPTAALMMLSVSLACGAEGAAKKPVPPPNLPAPFTDSHKLVLAGGCFWCTEGVFKSVPGVKSVVSGYAGGTKETANYKAVSAGDTDHAEAIEIDYDPAITDAGKLLRVFFAVAHDPTTKDRQGPDRGRQYRSAIFYSSDVEKEFAEAYIKQLNDAQVFSAPIVTTLEPLKAFYVAEAYHQDYVNRNPDNPYIEQQALPKIEKLKKFLGSESAPTTK
jgi:peptide-methionine (S)-S-oxide reductase